MILIKFGILILYTFYLFLFSNIPKDNYFSNYLDNLKIQYNNQDIVGLLEVENTNINEIIVKGSDNSYYLTHDLNHNYDMYGTIFIDYRNNLNDRKILLFGHNIEVGSAPFKELEKFLDKEFFEQQNSIYLTTSAGKNEYVVFSVMIVDSSSKHMNLNYDNWQEYLEFLKNNSIYQSNIPLDDDKIIVLQTCNFKPKNTYILVIAKEI